MPQRAREVWNHLLPDRAAVLQRCVHGRQEKQAALRRVQHACPSRLGLLQRNSYRYKKRQAALRRLQQAHLRNANRDGLRVLQPRSREHARQQRAELRWLRPGMRRRSVVQCNWQCNCLHELRCGLPERAVRVSKRKVRLWHILCAECLSGMLWLPGPTDWAWLGVSSR